MRFISKALQVAGLMAGAALFAPHAQAAAPCAIESQAPKIITVAAYTLLPSDECAALVFVNPGPTIVTVNAPVAAGYSVAVIPAGAGGVTMQMASPTTIFVNGASLTSAIIPQGMGTTVVSDGTNYFAIVGSPAAVSAFANLSSAAVYPGTLIGNSPVIPMPNGLLQITNPASVVPHSDAMKLCGGIPRAVGASRTQLAAFWNVVDWLNRPYRIPLCP